MFLESRSSQSLPNLRRFSADTRFPGYPQPETPRSTGPTAPGAGRAASDSLPSRPPRGGEPRSFPGCFDGSLGPSLPPSRPGNPRRPRLPYAVREAILDRVLPRLARASARAAPWALRPWTARPGECMRLAPAAPRRSAAEHAQSARRAPPRAAGARRPPAGLRFESGGREGADRQPRSGSPRGLNQPRRTRGRERGGAKLAVGGARQRRAADLAQCGRRRAGSPLGSRQRGGRDVVAGVGESQAHHSLSGRSPFLGKFHWRVCMGTHGVGLAACDSGRNSQPRGQSGEGFACETKAQGRVATINEVGNC